MLEQSLGQTFQRLAVLFADLLRPGVRLGHDALDLLVNPAGRVFRTIAVLSYRAAREDLRFLFAEGQRSKVRHTVLANHRTSDLGGLFDIVRRPGSDLADEQIFRNSAD